MPCFARLGECVPCFARKSYIYIYIYKAVRMYSMTILVKRKRNLSHCWNGIQDKCIPCFARKYYKYIFLYSYRCIYLCPVLQGCANVFAALQGNIVYIYIYYIYMPCFARLCECTPCFARILYIYIEIILYIYIYMPCFARLCECIPCFARK